MKSSRALALWVLLAVTITTISGCANWQTGEDTGASYPPPSYGGGGHHH